ncbi:hypothetical protein WOLCODRAFT_160959 [Wolfiporia cocos MD-104 SS10]|uniref:Uncharacterized protein n=1 Tax=Wolfiporia cocos (strain MD-104) TaxID=742152 RepID=A0A2H3J6X6_WOLCO|nr:hypothetical protein WOLCODRAFT_160959 [Wolfiporia cocos MD-104 SS10]
MVAGSRERCSAYGAAAKRRLGACGGVAGREKPARVARSEKERRVSGRRGGERGHGLQAVSLYRQGRREEGSKEGRRAVRRRPQAGTIYDGDGNGGLYHSFLSPVFYPNQIYRLGISRLPHLPPPVDCPDAPPGPAFSAARPPPTAAPDAAARVTARRYAYTRSPWPWLLDLSPHNAEQACYSFLSYYPRADASRRVRAAAASVSPTPQAAPGSKYRTLRPRPSPHLPAAPALFPSRASCSWPIALAKRAVLFLPNFLPRGARSAHRHLARPCSDVTIVSCSDGDMRGRTPHADAHRRPLPAPASHCHIPIARAQLQWISARRTDRARLTSAQARTPDRAAVAVAAAAAAHRAAITRAPASTPRDAPSTPARLARPPPPPSRPPPSAVRPRTAVRPADRTLPCPAPPLRLPCIPHHRPRQIDGHTRISSPPPHCSAPIFRQISTLRARAVPGRQVQAALHCAVWRGGAQAPAQPPPADCGRALQALRKLRGW